MKNKKTKDKFVVCRLDDETYNNFKQALAKINGNITTLMREFISDFIDDLKDLEDLEDN